MPGGAPIFQDRSYQSQIKNTAGTDRGTVESPVNEPNRSASFLTDMINLEIPGKVLSGPYPKEFG